MVTSTIAVTKAEARRHLRGRKAYVPVSRTEAFVPTTHAAVLDLIEEPIPYPDRPELGFGGTQLFLVFGDDDTVTAYVEERDTWWEINPTPQDQVQTS